MAIDITGDTSPIHIVADVDRWFNNNLRPQTTEKHIYQNNTPTFDIIIQQDGVGMNLNGLTVGFGAMVNPNSGIYIFNEIATITDAPNGKATITLTTTDTAIPGSYIADIKVYGGGGQSLGLTAIQFPLVIDPVVLP